MRSRAQNLGTIEAPDRQAAEDKEVKLFGLTEEQRKRLSAWEAALFAVKSAEAEGLSLP